MSVPFLIDDLSSTRVHGVAAGLKEATATPDATGTGWTVIVKQNATGGVQSSTPATDQRDAIAIVCLNLAN